MKKAPFGGYGSVWDREGLKVPRGAGSGFGVKTANFGGGMAQFGVKTAPFGTQKGIWGQNGSAGGR